MQQPSPNTQTVGWFHGEFEKGALDLKPKYQRNPIWSLGQQCFLIDSLISGCPIPQIYLNIVTRGAGKNRKTVYEVVDGQQRLRTILTFINDEWELVRTIIRSYPVSHLYAPLIGKKFSQLPGDYQDQIWNYVVAVQQLQSLDEKQIQALFRRLNYVRETLNDQELRHSQYFGLFAIAVEQLAKQEFWDQLGIFTRRDSSRMKDVEYVAELFVVVLAGIQDGLKTIDKYYADYDIAFPNQLAKMHEFKNVLSRLTEISDVIRETRFSNKTDFYGLFAATAEFLKRNSKVRSVKGVAEALRCFSASLQDTANLKGVEARYYGTIEEGSNKLAKRSIRTEIIRDILEKNLR